MGSRRSPVCSLVREKNSVIKCEHGALKVVSGGCVLFHSESVSIETIQPWSNATEGHSTPFKEKFNTILQPIASNSVGWIWTKMTGSLKRASKPIAGHKTLQSVSWTKYVWNLKSNIIIKWIISSVAMFAIVEKLYTCEDMIQLRNTH